MIVKNERHVIERCLSSVINHIDYWVIVDTGSTDGTQNKIKELMTDIPGELIERPWVDFAHNRTEALQYARGKTEYIFTIDADESFGADKDFTWPHLTHDSYLIEIDGLGPSFRRSLVFSNRLNWRFEGVLHEQLVSDEAKTRGMINDFKVIRSPDGARSQDPQKYKKDALILEKALLDEPDNTHYVFFLAQSYRDAGDLDSAIRSYEQVASMQSSAEMVWYSLYQIAVLKQKKCVPWKQVIEAFLSAYEFRPSRAEPLYHIMRYYIGLKQFHCAYLFGKQAYETPYTCDNLYVEDEVYKYRLPLDYAVCCYHIGDHTQAIEVNNKVLSAPDLSNEFFALAMDNRKLSLELLYSKRPEDLSKLIL